MQRRHKVLHLITRLELGGAQQNTLYCMRHHDREQFSVGLVAGRGGLLDEEAVQIPAAQIRLLPALRHAIAPFWDLVAICALFAQMRREGIKLVHTHSSKAGILGRLAAFLAGVPAIVHTVHGWSFNATQPSWMRWLYIFLERMAAGVTDKLIVVSDADRRNGLALGIGDPAKYTVVRSGIDVESFSRAQRDREELREELGFTAQDIVIGTVACLKLQKAPLDFVRAAAVACAADTRLRFFVAGDGPLRPELEVLAAQLGLEEKFKILGWRRDVADLLQAMDLFLLTSLFEGLPRAILQAMAAGLPVVATAVGGTPEVVEHGQAGMLVAPGRPSEAAAVLLELAGDEPLRERLSSAARLRLTEEFEIKEMVPNLERLYLALCSGH